MTGASFGQRPLLALHLLIACVVCSAGHAQNWSYSRRGLSEDSDCVEYVGFKPQPQSAKDYRSVVLPMMILTYNDAIGKQHASFGCVMQRMI